MANEEAKEQEIKDNIATLTSEKGKNERIVKKVNYHIVDKWISGISLVYFCVVMIAGFIQDAGVITITKRSLAVILILVFIKIVFVKILANYEEMNSGN